MANSIKKAKLQKTSELVKNVILYLTIGLLGLAFVYGLAQPQTRFRQETSLSAVLKDTKEGKVENLTLEGDELIVKYKDGQILYSRKEQGESIVKVLETAQINPSEVNLTIKDQSTSQLVFGILGTVLPILIMIGFFFFIFRQAREAGGSIFAFGKSQAKLFTRDMPRATFTDVAGVDEAKQELTEVVDFLKNPEKYRALGARVPKGVLLVGPAGCGKTLLARAVAGEANVPFYSAAGSEFMEMLVGVGPARIRDLFQTAKKTAPSIIFIDEIEAVGRMRGMGFVGGHDEREQTLNQILVEMDGFTPTDRVIVLGASITGETPILIRENGRVSLVSIGEFVDKFYLPGEEGIQKEIHGIEALGFEKRKPLKNHLLQYNLYFGNSSFKKVKGVFRHKVSEVYEIEYLGGKIRATANHSVFVRTARGIIAKPAIELQKGDILVDLPYKANRAQFVRREIRAHNFPKTFNLTLPLVCFSEEDQRLNCYYQLVLENQGVISQQVLASQTGVSQTTVGNWQRNRYFPRSLSPRYFQYSLPNSIRVTPDFCRLLGLYTAEGYARKGLDFCFGRKEVKLQKETIRLMKYFFNLLPDNVRYTTNNAVNIIYYASQLTEFFSNSCGKSAHKKHAPAFLFEAPREYFLEYLRGIILGDGYIDKRGKTEITSVSQRLILELNWLCRMHGIKSYVDGFTMKAGRKIGNGKPLPATQAYRLGISFHSNPFNSDLDKNNNYAPLPRIKSIKKVSLEGFVYDLCGLENEAFFGGESPILLHNSNRPDLLDPALVRPGRFDRRVVVDLPDIEGRKAIIQIHMRGKPFDKEVDTGKLARRTVGFSGADLANMLNEAAILAARTGKKAIDARDLEEAATKVKLGPQRKRMQSEEERKLAAYHESGHALVAHFLPHIDPVHRISIVARGLTGGHTLIPPQVDRTNETKTRLLEQISTLLGGRAAEELVFGDYTTGAASDLEIASGLARSMVTEFGMSGLGPIATRPRPEFGLWPREELFGQSISQDLAAKVDREVEKIINTCYKQTQKLLKEHQEALDRVAKTLLEKETLEGEEFEKLVGVKKFKA